MLPLGLGGTSGVLGIRLLLLMNLPLESLSLRISFFWEVRNRATLLHFLGNGAKMSTELSVPKLMS